jgi:formylglycine-generating enzyme required for sulfatase activity
LLIPSAYFIARPPAGWSGCATKPNPVVHQDKQERRLRVFRGGGWINVGRECRSANRRAGRLDAQLTNVGFRLARGLADQPDQPIPATT